MPKELILTEENIKDFLLKEVGPHLDYKIKEIKECDEISRYSNNNYLWRVKAVLDNGKEKIFWIKQARKYNKRALSLGKKRLVDPLRICGEIKMIQLLQKIWGKEFVPEIYYFNSLYCVAVMSDVSKGGKLLIEEFEKDKIHPELGSLFGRLFGALHGMTYGHNIDCCSSEKWRQQLYNFFDKHLGLGIRKFVPAKKVNLFYRETKRATPAAIWADPVHRNIFVKKDGRVTMVDFDLAISYDPAFDNGMFLAHWVWMSLKNKKLNIQSQKFIKDYWQSYISQLKKNRKIDKIKLAEIRERTIKWLGIYLVSRIDGKSGSYFKQWPDWEKKIRELGVGLFIGNISEEARKINNLFYAEY
jgi:5-methylthioribose kinase